MDAVTDPSTSWWRALDRRALAIGAAVLAVGYLPLTALGPGTDLDVGGVYNAGRSILDGEYQVSRLPGAPVFETASALLHAVGGSLAVNLGSLVMAAVTALAVARLLQREGHPRAAWFGLAVILNPFVWIAGTSMVDFLWATGLALTAFNLQLSRRWAPAVILYALAAGCRLSTLVVVAAFLLADGLGSPAHRRALVATAAGVGALTALVYLPPFLDHGVDLLRSGVQVSTWLVQIGRFGYKNLFFFGPPALVLVGWLTPRIWRSGARWWSTSTVLRAGVLGFVASELLFLRFPWKLAHLIPALLCLVLVLGATRVLDTRWFVGLLATQVVLGLVTVNLVVPDRPHEATGGRVSIEVVEGAWLLDLRCRLDGDRDAYRRPGEVQPLLDTWNCVIPWTD